MQDARYWRHQAALCMEIAGHLSDLRAAEGLRVAAADYFARATELERQAENGNEDSKKKT
jgi:hypothetical protein